jgi:hypothetical protein
MSAESRITPEHVAGLVVGEGCFYAESAADAKYTLGWRIRPAFCVEMRADDLEALKTVKAQIGCGRIYQLDFGRYRGYEGPGWHPHAKFRVTRIRDLADNVVPFFNEHTLFGRKKVAYELWAQLVKGVSVGEHRNREGLAVLKEVAERLAMHNRRGTET